MFQVWVVPSFNVRFLIYFGDYSLDCKYSKARFFTHFLLFVGFSCATKLTLKTQTTKEGHAYCKSHVPHDTPDQGLDMKQKCVLEAPKQKMGYRTITEIGGSQGSLYSLGAVAIETAVDAPKPPTTVNNINNMEILWQGGTKYTATN